MIKLMPFRGVRYNQSKIDNIAEVMTPPYDVISEEQQQKYYDASPYNIIRLELGKEFSDDTKSNNKYTRAAHEFQSWLNENIMEQDDEPSLYIYEQQFVVNGTTYSRTGFIGLIELQEFSKGNILPHENTLSKPKVDRLNLMRACNANFSQVFALYDDENEEISRLIRQYKGERQPETQFKTMDNITESLWKLSDARIISKIQKAMSTKKLFIADGHHRYETALAYRDEQMNQNPNHTGNEIYNYVMMMLVAMSDPGLVVLPTHRCVNNIDNFNIDKFLNDVSEEFSVSSYTFKTSATDDKAEELEYTLTKAGKNAFAFYDGNGFDYHIFKLKDIDYINRYIPDRKPSYKELDVTVLHTLILDNILGIGDKELANQENITYTHDFIEGLRWVEEGKQQFIFFMNFTTVEQVKNVSLDGEKMPQKSTYFYPKLITGLVVNRM